MYRYDLKTGSPEAKSASLEFSKEAGRLATARDRMRHCGPQRHCLTTKDTVTQKHALTLIYQGLWSLSAPMSGLIDSQLPFLIDPLL